MTTPRSAHPIRAVLARTAALAFSVGVLAALMLQASGTSGCRKSVDGAAETTPSPSAEWVTPALPPSSTESATNPNPSPPAAPDAAGSKPYYFPATKAAPITFPQQAPNGSPRK